MSPLRTAAALLFMAALPSVLFAGVRVDLKNGRTITADSCHETGPGYLCSKSGGEFEIDKADVAGLRKGPDSDDYEPRIVVPESEAEAPAAPQSGKEKGPGQKQDDASAGRRAELEKRREQLVGDREKLQADVKKSPDWMPEKQFEELQKRSADYDARLKKYNEEVRQFNEQQKKSSEAQPDRVPAKP